LKFQAQINPLVWKICYYQANLMEIPMVIGWKESQGYAPQESDGFPEITG
jgi:hypothetical protein